VLGKGAASNFGVRGTSPGAIGILSEILALDLGGERRFRFGHNCLLAAARLKASGMEIIGTVLARRKRSSFGGSLKRGWGRKKNEQQPHAQGSRRSSIQSKIKANW
jgi:hypothetical protein